VFGKNKSPFKQYIKNVLGFTPRDVDLYEQALAHRSVVAENIRKIKSNNERLEYLGDAVLSAVIADFLYKKYPRANEGFLTNLRSKLVSREHLNKLSQKIGLDVFIKKDSTNISLSRSINGDAFEAFIGAVYLDKGYRFTRNMIINRIIDTYIDVDDLEKKDTNYKGRLLVWSQKNKRPLKYRIAQEIRTANRKKQYIVHLYVDDKFVSEGCDFNIKGAEQQASMYACEELEI
jgi:ribonuclease-3